MSGWGGPGGVAVAVWVWVSVSGLRLGVGFCGVCFVCEVALTCEYESERCGCSALLVLWLDCIHAFSFAKGDT